MSRLVVGLGNTGKEYAKTRHNIGFMCLDFICKELKAKMALRPLMGGMYAQISHKEKTLHFYRPISFMNTCGPFVSRAISSTKTEIQDMIILHDDLDIK